MAGAPWNCCCISASSMDTIQPCTMDPCMFSCNLPPVLLAEWPDLLHTTATTRGCNGYQNKSQHRKLTSEKKILLPGLKLETFRSWVRYSTTELSPLRGPGIYGAVKVDSPVLYCMFPRLWYLVNIPRCSKRWTNITHIKYIEMENVISNLAKTNS